MNFYSKVSTIKALVLDIDGVLTDNTILVTDQGEFLRIFNVRDGYAIKRAIQSDLKIAVISGGRSMGTQKRLAILGVEEIFLGVEDKLPVFQNLANKWNISMADVAYMGDDIPDIEVLKHCGLAACPADAVQTVVDICDFVSYKDGGKGCVRDLIEKILQAKNLW